MEEGRYNIASTVAYHLTQIKHRQRAEKIARPAADVGDLVALTLMAQIRYLANDLQEASRFADEAASAGDPSAYLFLAEWSKDDGDNDRSEHFYRLAAEARSPDALMYLGDASKRSGDYRDAEKFYRLAREAGDQSTIQTTIIMEENARNYEEAERLAWEVDSDQPHILTVTMLVQLRLAEGRNAEAERLARLAADSGSLYPLVILARHIDATPEWKRFLRYGLEADGSVSEKWW